LIGFMPTLFGILVYLFVGGFEFVPSRYKLGVEPLVHSTGEVVVYGFSMQEMKFRAYIYWVFGKWEGQTVTEDARTRALDWECAGDGSWKIWMERYCPFVLSLTAKGGRTRRAAKCNDSTSPPISTCLLSRLYNERRNHARYGN
jgi:hypothetical protein